MNDIPYMPDFIEMHQNLLKKDPEYRARCEQTDAAWKKVEEQLAEPSPEELEKLYIYYHKHIAKSNMPWDSMLNSYKADIQSRVKQLYRTGELTFMILANKGKENDKA